MAVVQQVSVGRDGFGCPESIPPSFPPLLTSHPSCCVSCGFRQFCRCKFTQIKPLPRPENKPTFVGKGSFPSEQTAFPRCLPPCARTLWLRAVGMEQGGCFGVPEGVGQVLDVLLRAATSRGRVAPPGSGGLDLASESQVRLFYFCGWGVGVRRGSVVGRGTLLCPAARAGESTCDSAARAVLALGLHTDNVRHLCCTNPALLVPVEGARADVSDPEELLGHAGSSALCYGEGISLHQGSRFCVCALLSLSAWEPLVAVSEEGQAGAGVPSAGCWPEGSHPIPPCAEPPCCSEPQRCSRLWAGSWIRAGALQDCPQHPEVAGRHLQCPGELLRG